MNAFRRSGCLGWVIALGILMPLAADSAEDHEHMGASGSGAESQIVEPAGHGEEQHPEQGEAHTGDAHDDDDEELVRLAPEVLAEFGIEVQTAASGWISRYVALPAEVRPNQDRVAHIAPRFPGIVKQVRKRIGDSVRPGDVLAVIESSQSLAPYSLKTEIAGVVIAKHITRGEPVSRETQAFIVADLQDVWVDISVYQKDIRLLRLGQPVLVSAGHDLEEAAGELSYLSPVVDEETRTATARVVLPNPDGVWRPGMFVTVRVEVGRDEAAVAVPATAIEIIDDLPVIFVKEHDGFTPRQITQGRSGGGQIEVLSGVAPGESYVSRGGFTLKAELAKDELSGGHSH